MICKKCPFKGTNPCMTLFARKYHNSCVTFVLPSTESVSLETTTQNDSKTATILKTELEVTESETVISSKEKKEKKTSRKPKKTNKKVKNEQENTDNN